MPAELSRVAGEPAAAGEAALGSPRPEAAGAAGCGVAVARHPDREDTAGPRSLGAGGQEGSAGLGDKGPPCLKGPLCCGEGRDVPAGTLSGREPCREAAAPRVPQSVWEDRGLGSGALCAHTCGSGVPLVLPQGTGGGRLGF